MVCVDWMRCLIMPNECLVCGIFFKNHTEKTDHDMKVHQRYASTDNQILKQYVGRKDGIKDDPMICVEHQVVIGSKGCKVNPNCGKLSKELFVDIEKREIVDLVQEKGVESSEVRNKIIEYMNMGEGMIKDVKISRIHDGRLSCAIVMSIADKNLNLFMKLSEFKKMIREKNAIEVGEKLYYMGENRVVDIEGRRILVKVF